jgi:hypothetical protein
MLDQKSADGEDAAQRMQPPPKKRLALAGAQGRNS